MSPFFKVQPVPCSLMAAPSAPASAGALLRSCSLPICRRSAAVPAALGGGGGSGGACTARGAHAFGGQFICASELRVFQLWTESQLIDSGKAEPNRTEHPPPPWRSVGFIPQISSGNRGKMLIRAETGAAPSPLQRKHGFVLKL